LHELLGRQHISHVVWFPDLASGALPTFHSHFLSSLLTSVAAEQAYVHLTLLGSGELYQAVNSAAELKFSEDDIPNFQGSELAVLQFGMESYLATKRRNVLNLRLCHPFTADRNPSNWLMQLLESKSVTDVPQSISVMPSLWPHISFKALRARIWVVSLERYQGSIGVRILHRPCDGLCFGSVV
jgi:hypothetical protein